MRRQYTLGLILVNLLLAQCALKVLEQEPVDENNPAGHAAVAIIQLYQSLEENRPVTVIPYIVTLMALDLLAEQSNIREVTAYIQWYLDHLNYPDKYGATGSIYDYRVHPDGTEESLESYDSLDSYAATFIMLIDAYYRTTGDRQIVETNVQAIHDIAYLAIYTQDNDGLSIAIPGTTGKYLMDNCEVYGGLTAYLELAGHFNWDLEAFYRAARTALGQRIRERFYDGDHMNYAWLIDGVLTIPSDWNQFYPDSLAQLFPILYRLEPDPSLKNHLWTQFHQYHQSILAGLPVEQQIIYRWTKEEMEQSPAGTKELEK